MHTSIKERFDEASRRRPDFAGGESVELANQQSWHFPTVTPRLETRIGSSGPIHLPIWVVDDGPVDQAFEDQFQAALDAFIEVAGEEGMAQQVVIDLATVLLQRNYSLTRDECDWLVFEGFWQQARHDTRFLTVASQVVASTIRLGLKEPMDRLEPLKRGLPRHEGQAFQGFEVN